MSSIPIFDIPCRILVTGARAPAATDLVRWLTVKGHAVWSSDSIRFPPTRACRDSRGFLRYPSPRHNTRAFNDWIGKTSAEFDLIWPCCEEVFWLAQIPGIPLFAPSIDVLTRAHDKGQFAEWINQMGHEICAPESRIVACNPGEKISVPGDMVAKPVFGRFGIRTQLGPNILPESRVAENWLFQKKITGQELSTYAVCIDGKVVADVLYSDPERRKIGPCLLFNRERDPLIEDFVRKVVKNSNWNGQIAFDLMRDASGQTWSLECNPRLTSGIHLLARPQKKQVHLGLARLLRSGRLSRISDLWAIDDGLSVAGDRWPLWMALLTGLELWGRFGGSLEKASTKDLEWP